MDPEPRLRADGSAGPTLGNSRLWYIALLGLLAWQGWMTLTLFGPENPWQRLLDDNPVISGRHALHYYHGLLGALSLRETGRCCCYDSAFESGYPKTPVFDDGSRPAELFLLLGGAAHRPAAYKIGLALCCCLVPLLLLVAARGVGLNRAASCLAVALGLLVWWGVPGRELLEAGDLNLLLAGLAVVAQVGLLVQFDRAPGLLCWLGLVVTGFVGWFSTPVLFFLLFPLLLVYYLSVGVRHAPSWHFALLLAQVGPLAINGFWLFDWLNYWWIRLPLQLNSEPLRHRTFHTIWNASLWGGVADRALAGVLFGLAVLGVCGLNETKQRPAARMLGLGAGSFLLLAVLGISWEPLGRLGAAGLLVPALWLAIVPAVFALVQIGGFLNRCTGKPWRAALLATCLLAAAGILARAPLQDISQRCAGSSPLTIGLGQDRTALVEAIKAHTTSEARILWEDFSGGRTYPRWTPLLPLLLTDRAFLGGLEPNACIEHCYADLVDRQLAGRPIADWTDAELEDFCQRYNVGWVACWSAAAAARFQQWKGQKAAVSLPGPEPGYLFFLGPKSYFLKGKGRFICADRRRIALADVVPEDGQVVLAFHYQEGMQASPGRVSIGREPDTDDPIPFIRLLVPGPVAHITLTWEKR